MWNHREIGVPLPVLTPVYLLNVEIANDRCSDLGKLHSGNVLARAGGVTCTPLKSDSVSDGLSAPGGLGSQRTGMKYFSLAAASASNQRSGRNSRASWPHSSLDI